MEIPALLSLETWFIKAPEYSCRLRSFLRAVSEFSLFWRSKQVVRSGFYVAMLLRLERTFGRFAISSGLQQPGVVDKSRYSI